MIVPEGELFVMGGNQTTARQPLRHRARRRRPAAGRECARPGDNLLVDQWLGEWLAPTRSRRPLIGWDLVSEKLADCLDE